MKKTAVLMGILLVMALAVMPALAFWGNQLDLLDNNQPNQEGAYQEPAGLKIDFDECTIGVNHASITTHEGPVLWKVADGAAVVEGGCGIVKYYSSEDWGTKYNLIAALAYWEDMDPDDYRSAAGGLNEAGVATGNSAVNVGYYTSTNTQFNFHVLGNYGDMAEIRAYIESQTEFTTSGCFPFIDSAGNASMFELDPSEEDYWEYDTMAPARAIQGLQGFVVRANEFHKQDDGTDDTSIAGRYATGTENTLGLIAAGEFNEQSVAQSDSSEVYRLIRQNNNPHPISNEYSQGAIVIRGAAAGEDPALATMWTLAGNPSFSIAVPAWVAVSEIPEPIGTCAMYNAVTSLFNEETSLKGKQIKAEWVQAAVLPAEAHLFAMVNDRLLPHWRTLEGAPDGAEMTRIEHQMAWDAYRVVNYLATTQELNLAPTVDFEAQQLSGNRYKFNPDAADADGGVASYEWNFGDGETSTKAAPVHEFPGAGAYLVSVTVADDDGVTTTAWRYLTIP